MTNSPLQPDLPLQIRTPCPKTWDELAGDGPKRFCSQCSLHVHDGSQLSREEAVTLVLGATERVCMRLQFDATGAPLFRTVESGPARRESAHTTVARRIARWTLSTAAGLLAACHRGEPIATPIDPGPSANTTDIRPVLGEACVPERLGDVAAPTVKHPEIMGKVAAPQPTAAPVPPSGTNGPK